MVLKVYEFVVRIRWRAGRIETELNRRVNVQRKVVDRKEYHHEIVSFFKG